MRKYLKADLRRIGRKKSRLIWFFLVFLTFGSVAFFFKTFHWDKDMYILSITGMITFGYTLFVGIPLFVALFADELKSKTHQQIIGRGMSRTALIIAKVIEALVMDVFYALTIFLMIFGSTKLFGIQVTTKELLSLVSALVSNALIVFTCICIAMIFVFLWEGATSGIIIYVLLVMNIFETIVLLIFTFGPLSRFADTASEFMLNSAIMSSVNHLMAGKFDPMILFVIGVYVILPIIITINVFKNQELGF